jgi:hypothetical protein
VSKSLHLHTTLGRHYTIYKTPKTNDDKILHAQPQLTNDLFCSINSHVAYFVVWALR